MGVHIQVRIPQQRERDRDHVVVRLDDLLSAVEEHAADPVAVLTEELLQCVRIESRCAGPVLRVAGVVPDVQAAAVASQLLRPRAE